MPALSTFLFVFALGAAALLVDRAGLFGRIPIDITVPRILAAALIAAGVALFL